MILISLVVEFDIVNIGLAEQLVSFVHLYAE